MAMQEITMSDVQAPPTPAVENDTSYYHPAFIPLVVFLLGWWVYSVIWVALQGVDGGYLSITTYFGQPARLTEDDKYIIWALLTGLKEGTQLVIHFQWRWFTKSGERLMLGFLILLIAFVFVLVDVAVTSTGWYVRIKPLDLRSIDWLMAGFALFLGSFGAVFAQAIGLHIVHKWWTEWWAAWHTARQQQVEAQNVSYDQP